MRKMDDFFFAFGADVLAGSLVRISRGSSVSVECVPCAAILASVSARSLPTLPLCLGTHSRCMCSDREDL